MRANSDSIPKSFDLALAEGYSEIGSQSGDFRAIGNNQETSRGTANMSLHREGKDVRYLIIPYRESRTYGKPRRG